MFIVGNTALNPAHIIHAEFQPATHGNTSVRYKPAKLIVTISAIRGDLERDNSAFSESFTSAAVHCSVVKEFTGTEAEALWRAICNMPNTVDVLATIDSEF